MLGWFKVVVFFKRPHATWDEWFSCRRFLPCHQLCLSILGALKIIIKWSDAVRKTLKHYTNKSVGSTGALEHWCLKDGNAEVYCPDTTWMRAKMLVYQCYKRKCMDNTSQLNLGVSTLHFKDSTNPFIRSCYSCRLHWELVSSVWLKRLSMLRKSKCLHLDLSAYTE